MTICSDKIYIIYTVEPPIKDTDTIEITSEQRTSFNVPNGDFPRVLIPVHS